jgi:hypothetical protein
MSIGLVFIMVAGAKRYGDVDQIMIRDIVFWVMLALLYL